MSDHNTHHDDHGHETSKPHAGYFEIPLVLGGVFWGLVIMIVNILSCSGCCEDGKGACCKEGASCEKTEVHAGGGEGHH